jgi:hypothetical protein
MVKLEDHYSTMLLHSFLDKTLCSEETRSKMGMKITKREAVMMNHNKPMMNPLLLQVMMRLKI